MFDALLAAAAIALISVVGALFFSSRGRIGGLARYIVPGAVGVFLSLVLFELIPETLHANEFWGGIVVAAGFISFYVLSHFLHRYFHRTDDPDCERKGAAMLLLVGDAIHNFADGIILGSAFLLNPAAGVATGVALAAHEVPQEIVEFGVLMRAGYTRLEAIVRNLLSASTIILGTLITFLFAAHAEESVWIITGLAAGNLLYLAASDLLPRIHGNLRNYGSFWLAVSSIVIGFAVMTAAIAYAHEHFGGHEHDESIEIESAHTAAH